jgi:ketosteroid isomerase-like protein
MSEGQQNVAIAREGYAAFARGDVAGLLAMYSDDCAWDVGGPPDLPWAGTWRGKQGLMSLIEILDEELEFHAFEAVDFIGDGDKVVVTVTADNTVRRTGRRFVNHEAHVSTFRDGRCIHLRIYDDTAMAADAYRGT